MGAYSHGRMGASIGCCEKSYIGKEYETMPSPQVGYQFIWQTLEPSRDTEIKGRMQGSLARASEHPYREPGRTHLTS